MKIEIKVPAMGESVLEAVVSNIRLPSGSTVPRESELLELETDKVNQVVYAPESGLLSLSVKVGDTVKVGQVIGTIDTDVKVEAKPVVPPSKPAETGSVRRMAPEFVAFLGKQGEKRESASLPSNRKKMSTLRRTIAARLVAAKNNTAMLTNFNEVDMSRIIDIRTKEKENFSARHGVKLGLMSFFVKAVVAALKAFPQVAAWIDGDDIVSFDNYDIGVAVSTDKGLMVPVVRGCDTASLADIEKQIELLAKKAREGTISLDDLKGGCFTITNGGIFGSLLSTPILNPPQSGILGMHNILKRPVVVNDAIVIRPMMYLALSYDHRIIDGKEAVLFLGTIKEQLENPQYEL